MSDLREALRAFLWSDGQERADTLAALMKAYDESAAQTPAADAGLDPLTAEEEKGLRAVIDKSVADGYHYHPLTVKMLLATLDAARAQTPAAEGEEPQDYAVLRSAFDLACGQIEADAHAIERLKRALRVAAHKPHDQAGEPDPESGFPVCSVCGAIQTQTPAADAGLDAKTVERALSSVPLPNGTVLGGHSYDDWRRWYEQVADVFREALR